MAYKRIAFFLAGLVLVLVVLSYFGLAEIAATLVTTRIDVLLLLIILELAALGMLVLRLKILAYGKGYLPFSRATRVTFSGMFVSMITPMAKIGGEPLKIYMLRNNLGNSNASAVVAIDSFIEVVSSVLVVLAVSLIFFSQLPSAVLSYFFVFLVVSALLIGVLMKILLTPKWLRRIINWFLDRIAHMQDAKRKDYANMFYKSFNSILNDRGVIFGAFAVAIFTKMIEIIKLWLVFFALSSYLPFREAVVVWTIVLVLLFVPWLPGSLGLVEFGAASAFVAFGIAPNIAGSAVVIDRFVSLWLPLFVGLAALTIAKRRGELPDLRTIKGKTGRTWR